MERSYPIRTGRAACGIFALANAAARQHTQAVSRSCLLALPLAAISCAGIFIDGRVGGYFPTSLPGASAGIGSDWAFGHYVLPDVGLHLGVGSWYVGNVATGCRKGPVSACTGPNGIFDSRTGGIFTGSLMGGLKLRHQFDRLAPFVRGEAGVVLADFSHGLDTDESAVFGWRAGGGVTWGGFGIEGAYLRTNAASFPTAVNSRLPLSAFTLALTAGW